MALTTYQRSICQLIAEQRIRSGESYIAGGAALNLATESGRISRDIDIFHDTASAVEASWEADRQTLEKAGFAVEPVRVREGYAEALVCRGVDQVILQWTADSAFRFFPLVAHEDFGLMLHPFDLATNKALALVGRLEPRDWVDLIAAHARIQPLGYLAWAACGKDPGFSPISILEQAGRSGRYAQAELDALAFTGTAPDAAQLSTRWHAMQDEAGEIVQELPIAQAGKCVLDMSGHLFTGDLHSLRAALDDNQLLFHAGRIGGALPRLR